MAFFPDKSPYWGNGNFSFRYISKKDLIGLLQEIPDDVFLGVTPVGEIGVYRGKSADGLDFAEMLGYISIGSEEWNAYVP